MNEKIRTLICEWIEPFCRSESSDELDNVLSKLNQCKIGENMLKKTITQHITKIDKLEKEITDLHKTIEAIYPSESDDWNSKWRVSPVLYNISSSPKILGDVRNLIYIKSFAIEPYIQGCKKETFDETALAVLKFVKSKITYKGDFAIHKSSEYWQSPEQTWSLKTGDCIAGYEEIHTKEGIKSAKDIKEGDLVLSYDFKKKKFIYKPIVKKWDKGKLSIKRVHFRNGQHIDVTDNHHMAVRKNQQGESQYIKQDLKDIDLSRWWNRKIPIAKKIPYKIKDINWLNKDLCLVLGHYLAEGWRDKKGYKIESSGYELIEDIIPLLEKNNIPFTEYKNNSGVPCIRFLTSDFKDYLKLLKKNSFDINLPEELFHLPQSKLKAILKGFWIGDGHNGNYPDKRGFNSNKQEIYSTSSEQWAKDIQRIGLQLGYSFHIWKQNKHKGVGTKPIYRVTYNPESHFLKDHNYKDISEVSISYIEDLGKCQTYDWEVKDTHTFVFKNGIITFQCEDGAILIASILRMLQVPAYRIKVCAGNVINPLDNSKEAGHAYAIYLADDEKWYVLDWCYWYNDSVNAFKKIQHSDRPKYKGIWFTFNDYLTWAEKPKTITNLRRK